MEELMKALCTAWKEEWQGMVMGGLRYSRGEGVKTNYLEAYYWAALAEHKGIKQATPLIKHLAELIPAGQVKKIQARADAWHNSNPK